MTFCEAQHAARWLGTGTLLFLLARPVAVRAQNNQQYPQPQYPQQQYPQQQYDQYGQPLYPQQQYPQQQYPQQQYPQQQYPQQQYPQQQYPQQQYPQQQYPQQQYPQQQYPQQQYDQYGQPLYPQQQQQQVQPPPGAPPNDSGASNAPPEAAVPTLVTALLELDLGTTNRVINLPTPSGLFRLDTGFVPAFGVRLGSRVEGKRLFLGVAVAYQSSLDAKGKEEQSDPNVSPLTSPIRSSHFEGGVMPAIHLGSDRDSASLGVFAGYGVRALATVEELRMPRFTLHGPVFRLEFELPLAHERVTFRLAPEAQFIVSVSRDVRRTGIVNGGAAAFGGEASVKIAVTSWAAAQLAYRESHESSKSGLGGSFTDVERYLLFSGVFRYF